METTYFRDIDLLVGLNTNTKEFGEFEEALDEAMFIGNPDLYIEAVQSMGNDAEKFAGTVAKNTIETTKGVAKVYSNTIDANATVIKSVWTLFIKSVGLISRIINRLMKAISVIPDLIIKMVDRISEIPGDIRNKIRGNIKLYITAADINNLYNSQLLQKLDQFIAQSKILVKGDTWGTLFHKRTKGDGGKMVLPTNDMKICRQMEKIYIQLKNTKFTQTVIEMGDPENIETYFGNKKSIKITQDLYGQQHQCTYFEALRLLIKNIGKREEELKEIRNSITDKYDESQINESFQRLNQASQARISTTIQSMSHVIGIIGNIVRYINMDLKTFQDAAEKLTKKKEKETNKKGNVNAKVATDVK